jgi:hypothetical protein
LYKVRKGFNFAVISSLPPCSAQSTVQYDRTFVSLGLKCTLCELTTYLCLLSAKVEIVGSSFPHMCLHGVEREHGLTLFASGNL